MSEHIADVKVIRAGYPGEFRGICSCGWAGHTMAFRLDAKLEAIMHADFATLNDSAPLSPNSAVVPSGTEER